MLQRVKSSKNDKDITNTYKIGSAAIKTEFAAAGVNLDKVHDIIEDMQEVFEDQKEIDAGLGEQIGGPSTRSAEFQQQRRESKQKNACEFARKRKSF